HVRGDRAVAVPELAMMGRKQRHGELAQRLDDGLARRRRTYRAAIADIVQNVARLSQAGDDRTDIEIRRLDEVRDRHGGSLLVYLHVDNTSCDQRRLSSEIRSRVA